MRTSPPRVLPCYACGCPAEIDTWQPSPVSLDPMPSIIDNRFAEFITVGTTIIAPILCWRCRGVVLLETLRRTGPGLMS